MAIQGHEQGENATARGVNRIDHFVIQVNDLWRSFEFYRDLLGAKIDQIAGADTERLWHRQNQIFFMEIAGHKGVGLAVSNVEFPSAGRMYEHYTLGFQVTEQQFQQMREALRDYGVKYVGPKNYGEGFPILSSLWFPDPDGHTVEVCVRPQISSGATSDDANKNQRTKNGTAVAPKRISHMRVEVTDVQRSSHWFQNTLGFEFVAEREGEIYLKVRDGDQLLVLRPTVELSPRRLFVHGPHIDLQVPPHDYPIIFERITDREGYWNMAPHPFPDGFSVDFSITVYCYDPDGNRFQVSPSGSHL